MIYIYIFLDGKIDICTCILLAMVVLGALFQNRDTSYTVVKLLTVKESNLILFVQASL